MARVDDLGDDELGRCPAGPKAETTRMAASGKRVQRLWCGWRPYMGTSYGNLLAHWGVTLPPSATGRREVCVLKPLSHRRPGYLT